MARTAWAQVHPESPANIPLVRQMLTDPAVRLRPRAVDNRWEYEGLIPVKTAGFNPLYPAVYYSARSALADWLTNPYGPARALNFRERLMREVLMAAHDYLHVWAYGAIAQLCPRLGLGTRAITRANLDEMVFCHLLTETVATVGLDYWYLATVDLNKVCDVGSTLEGLTVGYHDRHLDEYRRFDPTLDVHTQAFFASVVRLYCRGVFVGFTTDDVRRSVLLYRWLHHELDYGKRQREYARLWLGYLAEPRIELTPAELTAPVALGARWQTTLVRELGALLWEKVKEDRLLSVPPLAERWSSPEDRTPDFRFINLNSVGPAAAKRLDWSQVTGASFNYFLYQSLTRLDLGSFDLELLKLFEVLTRNKDAALVRSVLGGQRRVPAVRGEPRDLFLLN
jgi:hypothetical protein